MENSQIIEVLKLDLTKQAKQKYGDNLRKPLKCSTWDDCFTIHNDQLIFWFNTNHDDSTRVLKLPITAS